MKDEKGKTQLMLKLKDEGELSQINGKGKKEGELRTAIAKTIRKTNATK
jgi:hypothetical protein